MTALYTRPSYDDTNNYNVPFDIGQLTWTNLLYAQKYAGDDGTAWQYVSLPQQQFHQQYHCLNNLIPVGWN